MVLKAFERSCSLSAFDQDELNRDNEIRHCIPWPAGSHGVRANEVLLPRKKIRSQSRRRHMRCNMESTVMGSEVFHSRGLRRFGDVCDIPFARDRRCDRRSFHGLVQVTQLQQGLVRQSGEFATSPTTRSSCSAGLSQISPEMMWLSWAEFVRRSLRNTQYRRTCSSTICTSQFHGGQNPGGKIPGNGFGTRKSKHPLEAKSGGAKFWATDFGTRKSKHPPQ